MLDLGLPYQQHNKFATHWYHFLEVGRILKTLGSETRTLLHMTQ